MLSLVLPKGSLERATLDLFDAADLTVRRSSDRDYHASVDDPRIDRVKFLRPLVIPSHIAQGQFDIGLHGLLLYEDTGADDHKQRQVVTSTSSTQTSTPV